MYYIVPGLGKSMSSAVSLVPNREVSGRMYSSTGESGSRQPDYGKVGPSA